MPSPAHILILKLGDTLPELAAELGDFEHWVAQGLHSSGLPLDISTPAPIPASCPPSPPCWPAAAVWC